MNSRILIVSTFALSCLALCHCTASGYGSDGQVPEIPIPDWATESQTLGPVDQTVQHSFVVIEPWPSQKVADFYEDWVAEAGWNAVSEEEESWSTNGWQIVEEYQGATFRQWMSHWRSQDKTWGLRLMMLYRDQTMPDLQEVVVIVEPFRSLDDYGG